MATKRLKHPCDLVSLAKLMGGMATEQTKDETEYKPEPGGS